MVTEDTIEAIDFSKYNCFILTGIESHICVLQTALDLLQYRTKPKVYLAADAVSSCNKEEVPIALRYLQQQGVEVTSSESLIYRLLGDAKEPTFKYIAKLTKEEKENTTHNLQVLQPF